MIFSECVCWWFLVDDNATLWLLQAGTCQIAENPRWSRVCQKEAKGKQEQANKTEELSIKIIKHNSYPHSQQSMYSCIIPPLNIIPVLILVPICKPHPPHYHPTITSPHHPCLAAVICYTINISWECFIATVASQQQHLVLVSLIGDQWPPTYGYIIP